MTTPSFKRRIGMREIVNKKLKEKELIKEYNNKKEITKDEEEKRINILKSQGIIK